MWSTNSSKVCRRAPEFAACRDEHHRAAASRAASRPGTFGADGPSHQPAQPHGLLCPASRGPGPASRRRHPCTTVSAVIPSRDGDDMGDATPADVDIGVSPEGTGRRATSAAGLRRAFSSPAVCTGANGGPHRWRAGLFHPGAFGGAGYRSMRLVQLGRRLLPVDVPVDGDVLRTARPGSGSGRRKLFGARPPSRLSVGRRNR